MNSNFCAIIQTCHLTKVNAAVLNQAKLYNATYGYFRIVAFLQSNKKHLNLSVYTKVKQKHLILQQDNNKYKHETKSLQ